MKETLTHVRSISEENTNPKLPCCLERLLVVLTSMINFIEMVPGLINVRHLYHLSSMKLTVKGDNHLKIYQTYRKIGFTTNLHHQCNP